MINIITAMNNPELNEELKKENNINIICKDIFYKEGILEILENKKEKINYIIIDYNLPGEIELNNLFDFIKETDEKIKIILTIKKENKINIDNKKIIKIFYKNNINLNYLKNYNNIIIENKNINNKNNKINNIEKILFFGDDQVGKSMTILNIAYYLKNKNNKILIIEIKKENKNIYYLFNKKINNNTIRKENKLIKNNIVFKKLNKKEIKDIKNIINYKKIKKQKFNSKKLIINYKKISNKIFKNKKNEIILKNNFKNLDKNLDYIFIKNLINLKNIKNLEKSYNYILIKINIKNNSEKNKKIVKKFDNKILILKPNLLGIKNAKKIIEKFDIKNEKIIINNYNKYCIDEKIIKNIFNFNKIIGKIKYNEKYDELINTNFENFEKISKKQYLEIEKIVNNI